MTSVLIAGGGIGGLALAQGLRKHGVDVAVFERDAHHDDRVDRYRLAINPSGSRSLRACLPDAQWKRFLDTAGRPGGGFGFLRPDLRELVGVEDAVMYPDRPDPAERAYPVDRHSLRGCDCAPSTCPPRPAPTPARSASASSWHSTTPPGAGCRPG